MKILNSLSLNMYDGDKVVPVTKKLTLKEVMELLWIPGRDSRPDRYIGVSCIGHADLCKVLEKQLGEKVPQNRATLAFLAGDKCLIAQYIGQRLPEGCTELPSESKIIWFLVDFVSTKNLKRNAAVEKAAGKIAHSTAGWGLDEGDVMSFLRKMYPQYFSEGFFD